MSRWDHLESVVNSNEASNSKSIHLLVLAAGVVTWPYILLANQWMNTFYIRITLGAIAQSLEAHRLSTQAYGIFQWEFQVVVAQGYSHAVSRCHLLSR